MVRVGHGRVAERIAETLGRHHAIGSVGLTGSRARGDAGPLSDWDFAVETSDFGLVADALPELVAPLEPLAKQWDRLSEHACYMLLLLRIGKVDLIFNEPWEPSPPWVVSAETLRSIDDHFWDWTLWLASKDRAGKLEMVETELKKMHEHLLEPLGVEHMPTDLRDVVTPYIDARADAEKTFGTEVPRALEQEVRRLLAAGGYAV